MPRNHSARLRWLGKLLELESLIIPYFNYVAAILALAVLAALTVGEISPWFDTKIRPLYAAFTLLLVIEVLRRVYWLIEWPPILQKLPQTKTRRSSISRNMLGKRRFKERCESSCMQALLLTRSSSTPVTRQPPAWCAAASGSEYGADRLGRYDLPPGLLVLIDSWSVYWLGEKPIIPNARRLQQAQRQYALSAADRVERRWCGVRFWLSRPGSQQAAATSSGRGRRPPRKRLGKQPESKKRPRRLRADHIGMIPGYGRIVASVPAGATGRVKNPAGSKMRSQVRSSRSTSVRDGEDLARKVDRTGKRPGLLKPLRWLRDKLSRAADRVRASARSIRSLLSRAVGWLGDKVKSRARLIKTLFLAAIGDDRGFGFWWLVVTAAIALAIGLLVAVLLSPVIGILAALIVGIWMLVRGGRSSESRQTAKARLAS